VNWSWLRWSPPPLPDDAIPYALRLVGRATVERLWRDVWIAGRDAGRAEGIVGTSLAVIALFGAVISIAILVKLLGRGPALMEAGILVVVIIVILVIDYLIRNRPTPPKP